MHLCQGAVLRVDQLGTIKSQLQRISGDANILSKGHIDGGGLVVVFRYMEVSQL